MSYTQAIAAGLMTLGERHGPIVQTYRYLHSLKPPAEVYASLPRSGRMYGWGSSFVRRRHDPIWADVRERIMGEDTELSERIEATTVVLHNAGKFIFPNAACWSAAVAITLGMPPHVSPWLFVQGRLDAWSGIILEGAK